MPIGIVKLTSVDTVINRRPTRALDVLETAFEAQASPLG